MKTTISENLLNDPAVQRPAVELERKSFPVTNCRTPWGMADTVTEYGEGVMFYSTPGHGGFRLSKGRLHFLTQKLGPVKTFTGDPQWFEEDCDWSHVAVAFPELFTPEHVAEAVKMREWLAQRAKEGAR